MQKLKKDGAAVNGIEYAIVVLFRESTAITDYNVMHALEAAEEHYTAVNINREEHNAGLTDPEKLLFKGVCYICNWWLGLEGQELLQNKTPLTYNEIISCLRVVKGSVNKYTAAAGRQGYLKHLWHKHRWER